MYTFMRVSDTQYRRLCGIAKNRNTSPATLAGSIVGQFLSGKLAYVTKEKRQMLTASPTLSGQAPNAATDHE